MLYLIRSVVAIFFYHKASKHFLGVERRNNLELIVPVDDVSKAIDFKIRKEGVVVSAEYDEAQAARIAKKPSSDLIRIDHPTLIKSFDIHTGLGNDGNLLKLNASHNRAAQKFKLKMLSDFSFVLGFKQKCLKYNENDNNFAIGNCTGIDNSAFDLYMETVPEKKPKQEDVFNIKDDADSEFQKGFVENYRNGSVVLNKHRPIDDIATRIVFKNDTAIKTFPKDRKDDNIKFKHEEVGVIKKDSSVEPISRSILKNKSLDKGKRFEDRYSVSSESSSEGIDVDCLRRQLKKIRQQGNVFA
jgi:hypothetical protein